MKYPYLFQEGKFLPLIPLKLRGVKEWVEFRAYIDTGAIYSLFHADVGRRDVFEKFTICFHEKEKYVEFTPL